MVIAFAFLVSMLVLSGGFQAIAAEGDLQETYRQYLPLSFGEKCIPRPYIKPYDPVKDIAIENGINEIRANNGLSILIHSDKLAQAALRHSYDLADNNFVIGHIGTDGSDPYQRIDEACYRWRPYGTIGEIVAGGYHGNPDEVIDAWMNSPGHRLNILFAQFTEFGSGYVYKSRTTFKHYFTVNFGLPDTSSNKISQKYYSCQYYREDKSGEVWLNLYSVWPCDQLGE